MKSKKFIKTLGALLLCLLLSFETMGCNNKTQPGEEQKPVAGNPVNTVDPNLNEYRYNGTHIYNVKSTGKYIIKDGKTDYTIVYPENCERHTKTAVNEIVSFLALSTNVKIPAISDAELNGNSKGKYLSIGKTKMAENSGIKLDYDKFGPAGFVIKTVDEMVLMIGSSDIGTLYSAYEFLLRTIDFRAYYNDFYHYDHKDKIELYNFDITDIPDFSYRMRNYGVYDSDSMFARRMRIELESDVWIPVGNNYWHNVFEYLPKEKYAEDHPEWYSDDGMQLCFHAHGDEKEYEEMYDAILQKAIKCVDAHPHLENITFTQQDGAYWCTCEACRAEMREYGTGAPAIIKICNRLAKDLNDHVAGQNRKINVCLFAYGSSSVPPVNRNDDGSYSPIDENCVCGKNVYVFCAPLSVDYRYPVYDSKGGAWGENTKAWASLTEHMYMWVYGTNFYNYMMPYNTFDAMQANYKFLKSIGADYIFDQAQYNQSASPAWGTLKMWLNSKLAWNVDLDFNDLLDEFFANFYMEAEKPMREMFEMFRIHMRYIQSVHKTESGLNLNLLKNEYWPKATLDQLLKKADEAYEAIKVLEKKNPELYNILYDRICLETITFRYIDISLYNGLKNSSEQMADKKAFKADAERLGLTLFNEHNSISSIWSAWKM